MANIFKFSFFALVFIFPSFAYAEDVAVCGGSDGYSYYSYRKMGESNNTGWQEDKMSDGRFTFTIDDNGLLDLLVSDATGKVFSSVSQGAKIFPASLSDDAVSIIVLYENILIETYVFQKLKNGLY